jgi:hypothetical protein
MPDDIGKTLIRRASERGVSHVRIEQGGKHPRLIGDYKGVAFMFVFPGSTGDRRAVLNCLSDLRHVVGVEREGNAERRPEKQRLCRAKLKHHTVNRSVEPILQEDRFYAPLKQLRDAMLLESKDDEVVCDQAVLLRTPFLGRRQRFLPR